MVGERDLLKSRWLDSFLSEQEPFIQTSVNTTEVEMNSTEDLIFQSLSVCAGTLNQISVNIESPHKIADKKNYKF
jgi:hypothetical protein